MEVIIHELMHAMGFSSNMVKYFLDDNGMPRGDNVIKKAVMRGKETTFLDLPRVTEYAKWYFGCEDI